MYVKKIDPLGRIVIPKKILEELSWEKGDELSFSISKSDYSLILKKSVPLCIRCRSKDDLVFLSENVCLCKKCVLDLASEKNGSET